MSNTPMPTREQAESSRTWIELADKLGLHPRNDRAMLKVKTYVREHFSNAEIAIRNNQTLSLYKSDDTEFIKVVSQSLSVREALISLDLVPKGGAYKSFWKRVKHLQLDTKHFLGQARLRGIPNTNKTRPLKDYLVDNGIAIQSDVLKNRLIREGIKKPFCEICKNTSWNGLPIPIALDHINGNNIDNRLENLRILCPNCHAQTDTFCGKNITKQKPPCEVCGAPIKKRGRITCGEISCTRSLKAFRNGRHDGNCTHKPHGT